MKIFNLIKALFKKVEKPRVRCISNIGSWYITIGKEYEVLDIKDNPDGSMSYLIIDDRGSEKYINQCRFVKISN